MRWNILLVVFLTIQLLAVKANWSGQKIRRNNGKRMAQGLYSDFTQTDDLSEHSGGSCQQPNLLGSGSPKQKATSIAQKAAQEAKAASDAQNDAAAAASRHIKMQLADRARQAAKTAEAALAGKQQIMEQLEHEVREAEAVVQEESSSLMNAQNNFNAASQAARQARMQLQTLTKALQTAQANVGNAEQAATGAQDELSEKQQLLDAAKMRVEQLLRQLCAARSDFANTKQAAYKAASAAHEAKINAARSRRMLLSDK